jgi:hypothetical protein
MADAGMVSAGSQQAIEDAGLSFIGAWISDVPYVVKAWRDKHPGEDLPDGQIVTQPWPAGPASSRRDQVIYCQYKADRAGRPGPADPGGHRWAGRQGRESRRGRHADEAEPVRPARRAESGASTASSRRRPGPWPG